MRRRARQVGAFTRVELTQFVRSWYWSLSTLAIMLFYYLIFARLYRTEYSAEVTFGFVGLAVFATAVFQLSGEVSMERTQKFGTYLRTLPVPLWVRFTARIIVLVVFAFFLAISIVAAGQIYFESANDTGALLALPVVVVFAAAVFAPIGTCIGYLVPPNASRIVAMLVFLGTALGSGLFTAGESPIDVWWIRELLPLRLVQGFSIALLEGNLHGLVWPVVVGAEWALISLAIAIVGYRRDERARFS